MVEDSWAPWELPALKAVAEEFEAQPHGAIIATTSVLERLDPEGTQENKWGRAIDRLDKAGYIDSARAMWGRPYPMHVVALTERGLRAVGSWPNDQSVIEALAAALENGATTAEAKDPDAANRLRQVAAWFLAGGREVAAGVGQAYLKHLTGLP